MSRTKLAAYTLGALGVGIVLTVIAMSFVRGGASPGDDQPPIIVRDGSIYLDSGDVLYPHPAWLNWESINTSNTMYSPVHPTGAEVQAFEIIALNTVTSPSCPAGPMIVDHLDLTYTGVGGAPNTTAKIYISQPPGKKRAVFETSLKVDNVPMTSTNPGQLRYTTDGTLTGFTTTTLPITPTNPSASISCVFDTNNQGHGYLRVQPTR